MIFDRWLILIAACIALFSYNCWTFAARNAGDTHHMRVDHSRNFFERSETIPDIEAYRAYLFLARYMRNTELYYGDTPFPINSNNLYSVMLVRQLTHRTFPDILDEQLIQELSLKEPSENYPLKGYDRYSEVRIFPGHPDAPYYIHYYKNALVFVPESLMPALGGGQ